MSADTWRIVISSDGSEGTMAPPGHNVWDITDTKDARLDFCVTGTEEEARKVYDAALTVWSDATTRRPQPDLRQP